MKKQMVGLSVAAAVCVLGTTLMGAPAIAAPAGVSQVELEKTKSSLAASDIAPAQQAELLQKVTDGELWDAASGKAAVSSTTKQQGDYKVTKDVYADGSYTEMGIEQGRQASPAELQAMIAQAKPFLDGTAKSNVVLPPKTGGVSTQAQGVSNCVFGNNGGVRYAQSCHVYYHGVTWSNSFNANYQITPTSSKSQLIANSNKVVTVLAVSNEIAFSRNNGRDIRHQFNLSAGGWGNTPFWLDLRTTTGGASVARA
ncbi:MULTISPECIES: hypothetical protein [unclassified Frigoribacterium]|uniref:hypothetical protein n=1 Tax=unclassified Frigoribacterium TaxID=2627005 RepID=UPI000AB8A014|nr:MULTISPECIES: hypothetical protein [unclassified Frigoribacterium]MBD8537680.1 hypothetical protein [Frigoribacterium sp. CFBP 8751]WAC52182.1 hypothetical protein OVA02_02595 [Frigoribacterium sp. SL97]